MPDDHFRVPLVRRLAALDRIHASLERAGAVRMLQLLHTSGSWAAPSSYEPTEEEIDRFIEASHAAMDRRSAELEREAANPNSCDMASPPQCAEPVAPGALTN